MPINQDWLDTVSEPIEEPGLPIVDPHHHLWDHPNHRYMLDQLLSDIGSSHNVVATVFVECMSMYRAAGPAALQPVGETEFVNGIAAQSASGRYGESALCAGIVGFADLTLGAAVDEVLAAHTTRAPDRFRGIRHAAGWDASDAVRNSHTDPGPALFSDAGFREGFARLAAHDLSFEAWLYHPQLIELVDLARAHPDVTIILDHFGGPLGIGPYAGRRDEIAAQWRRDIAAVAACPNVVAKLGGINMAINGFGWHKRDRPAGSDELIAATGDYYHHTIDCFAPDRCMFESNFPVDKVSCSYAVLWNAFKKLSRGYTAAERANLFHGTADRVYRLNRF